jgi:hypothetical protein
MRSTLAIALLLLPSLSAMAASSFIALDLPGSQLTALADDGRSAAGSLVGARSGGFRWHADHGTRLLDYAVSVHGMSASGRYVAGSSLDANLGEVATYWDADDVAHAIGGLPGANAIAGRLSVGTSISDALRVTGTANTHDDRNVPFAWTPAGGMQLIDDANLALPQCAGAPMLRDAFAKFPQPVEFDAASRDGALLLGHAGSGGQRRAIVWTARDGAQSLGAFLDANGVDVPRDWTLVAATAVDANTRHIGGYGLHHDSFDSFIAQLPATLRITCDPTLPTAPQRRDSIQEITP